MFVLGRAFILGSVGVLRFQRTNIRDTENEPMRILVTGAAGQIGCRLVRQLLEHNYEVRGTVLKDDPAIHRIERSDVDLMAGDLTDEAFVERAVQGVDAVVHTANLVGPHFDNNVQTNRVAARVAGNHADRLNRYIYVSSSGVFPNDSHVLACAYHPVDELHPKRATGEYNVSKLVGEHFTEMAAIQTGLRTVIVRPSHAISGTQILGGMSVGRVVGVLKTGQAHPRGELYMADGTELWRAVEAAAASMDQPCDVRDLDGRPWLYQPNDARDVAHMLVRALEEDAAIGESFNCGAPRPCSFAEGARLIAEATGVEPLAIRLPVRWVYDHDISKAKSLIGYQPKGNLETMIRAALLVQSGEHDGYTWEGIA
jgi:nucleoside-diphosphate-sugar epimerase